MSDQHLAGTPTTIEDRSAQLEALLAREFPQTTPDQTTHSTSTQSDAIAAGGRNNTLASLAGTMRRRGFGEAAITKALLEHNRAECRPPLSDPEVRKIACSIARHRPADDTFTLTEAGDAECFASVFGDRVRLDHRRGRFLVFADHRWTPDP